ncbi:MAG: FAD-dependent oxidoreductase [Actinomycetia bacterium]|nr:FAD-dependent oxidoreductase [Actinomycetes bacterium]
MTAADVIVVGAGGSGLAAAAEAARFGSVIVLEKNPRPGGSTSWSVGSITATGTRHQRRAGISDSPDQHFDDMELNVGPFRGRDNLELRRILVHNIAETIAWLESLGVVFVGPMPEPPHRQPRMHVVVPNSRSFAYHLERHCCRLGVDIRLGLRAERLVEEDGAVVGVEARNANGDAYAFRARRGLVLAAGDFSGGRELKERFASPAVVDVEAVNPTATGDGQRLALELGATVVNGDIVRGPIMRFIPPTRPSLLLKLPPRRSIARFVAWCHGHLPQRVLRPFLMSFLTTALGPSPELYERGAVLINSDGDRFTDELDTPSLDVPTQPGSVAWIVFDHRVAETFSAWPHVVSTAPGIAYAYLADYRRNRPDIYHEARTTAGLAVSIGVSPRALTETLEAYAAGERGGRAPLDQPPYYAIGPAKSYVVFTDGGLNVNERLQVLREDGSVIPRLYAAGSNGQGGVALEGHGHHLGWAFTSGRIAGRNASEQAGAP